MKYSWIDTELLQKPGVTKDLQAEWNWIRYHIGGKMFAAVCLDDATGKPVYITCKLDPAEGDFLRRQYEDIIPGYYMNKVHWNSVKAEGNVPDALLREMLEKSYRLVLGGFSKKKQRELLEGEKSMAKQDNYKKERAVSVLSFHFSDFGMRGYISMMKPSGLFLRFSFSFW